jgi:UPF0755 protein
MPKLLKKLISIVIFIIVLIVLVILAYNNGISAVSSESTKVEFVVEQNSTYLSITNSLKENDLIKSELFYKLYIKFNNPSGLQAGKYTLDKNMSVNEIINILSKGSSYNPLAITLTFKEGVNIKGIVKVITDNTNNTSLDVYALLKDEDYLNRLIDKYWFLTDEIKNDEIYYPLEGYLYPDTYEYNNKDVTVEQIFEKMLDKMELELSIYKTDIEASNYSIHQILTLSSIVELEASATDDRAGVAGVFYNRLNNNWSLGSDVTTYYAVQLDMSERDLTQSEIDLENAYNTRSTTMAGKLPVGPICMPSIESIEATIYPTVHNYFFFVADKYKRTYFSQTYAEHNAIVAKLKEEDLWYNY